MSPPGDSETPGPPVTSEGLDDLPFTYEREPAQPFPPTPRKCRRHEWIVERGQPMTDETGRAFALGPIVGATCSSCGRTRDDAATRRGKNNRQRGNAIERAVGKELGLKRVGQFGGPDDLSGLAFAAQVKSGGAFSERYWGWLKAVPVTANQTPILVVTDAPGPGHKRRALVVLELSDWRGLHGEDSL